MFCLLLGLVLLLLLLVLLVLCGALLRVFFFTDHFKELVKEWGGMFNNLSQDPYSPMYLPYPSI